EEDIKESTTGRGDREMTTAMLLDEIQKTKNKSQESDNIYQKHRTKRRIYRYLVEINKKFSIAFGVYGFILLGSVIGISLRKSGMGVGFGISTILFVIYYIILVLGEQFSDKGLISPYITMWIPNIITMLFGFLMFYFTLMRMPPKIFSKIKSIGRNKNEDS
ncbi:LptF/LptG family permease, partial [candidate division WOR-3 bacterium]|nr:LptF/LptG family permease [candidate division WOR-3 bacterium]